jgi:geranylgeranyl pyrophosphate synthase
MYSEIAHFLSQYRIVCDWPQLQRVVTKIINEKPKHILIPGEVCLALGGRDAHALRANACLTLAFGAVILVDDVLDGDGRFREGQHTEELLALLASGMIPLAFSLVSAIREDPPGHREGIALLSEMLAQVAYGQSLDGQHFETEQQYWQVARLKSGSFFSGAFALGGLAARCPPAEMTLLEDLGCVYGLLIQLHDDLRDCLAVPADPDWANARFPLPILYATRVDHAAREEFIRLRTQVDHPEKLSLAQEILVKSGAISYGLFQIQEQHARAMDLLGGLQAGVRRRLARLFDETLAPVESLLERVVV